LQFSQQSLGISISNADIILSYCYFAGKALFMTSQSTSRIEYLLPTNNILVLDC